MKVIKENSNQVAIIDFDAKGWFAGDKDRGKIKGQICNETDNFFNKYSDPIMQIKGSWTSKLYLKQLLPKKQPKEMVWSKNPYPE